MKSCHTLLAGVLALPAAAQSPLVPLPMRGMLPSLQIGVVFDNDPNLIARKVPGLPAELHTFAGLGRPGVPEYTAAAIQSWVSANRGPCPLLELDAMSTGNDLVPVVYNPGNGDEGSEAFRISQGTVDSWAALFLSIEEDSSFVEPADIVGYYFDNPSFPSQLRQAWYHEILRTDYVDGLVTAPTSGVGIAAIDSAMGVIETTGGVREWGVIMVLDKLYFSLRPNNATAFGTALGVSGCDGATIFLATYNLSTGAVNDVSVAWTGTQLGLAEGDDVDALGVGKAPAAPSPVSGDQVALHPGSLVIVFSTTPGSTFGDPLDQVMVQATEQGSGSAPGSVRTLPLRKGNGDPLVGAVGTLVGNVTGICSKDPETVDPSPASFGRASHVFDPFDTGLSLYARAEPSLSDPTASVDSFRLTGVLSGWGATGVPHDAFVYVTAKVPGSSSWDVLPHLLPLRTVADGTYEFELHLEYAWQAFPGGARNEYEFQVTSFRFPIVAPFHVLQSPIMKMTRWL